MARPTPKPGPDEPAPAADGWVRKTAVKPLIKPMKSMGASILPTKMLLKRLTNTVP